MGRSGGDPKITNYGHFVKRRRITQCNVGDEDRIAARKLNKMDYTQKIIEKRIEEKNQRIDEAIQKREFRQTKTELNINFSWAVNNANNFLKEKDKGTAKGFELIKKWFPEFIVLYREWAIENIPVESAKLGKEDFIQAKVNAPKSQIEQDVADYTGEEAKFKEQEQRANEETFNLASLKEIE